MSEFNQSRRAAAVQDFHQARRQATLERLLSKLTGKPDELLPFDEVRRELGLVSGPNRRYLDDIPIDSIVGSVERYYDFNRRFRPLFDEDEGRWARVKQLVEDQGLPPVEVYKIGQVYFVLDGNHRVSVARQVEARTIEAYVNEFRTNVSISPQDKIKDVILKVERAECMEDTGLDQVRPDLDIDVTVVGRYCEVSEHIAVHRHYMGLEQNRSIPMEEAAVSWVENVYLPAVHVIRETKVLEDFPGRTETDLYLWLKKHEWELQAELGKNIEMEAAAEDFAERFSERLGRVIGRRWERVITFWRRSFRGNK